MTLEVIIDDIFFHFVPNSTQSAAFTFMDSIYPINETSFDFKKDTNDELSNTFKRKTIGICKSGRLDSWIRSTQKKLLPQKHKCATRTCWRKSWKKK